MSNAQPPSSKQDLLLLIIPRITGSLSILGSSYIIYDVIFKNTNSSSSSSSLSPSTITKGRKALSSSLITVASLTTAKGRRRRQRSRRQQQQQQQLSSNDEEKNTQQQQPNQSSSQRQHQHQQQRHPQQTTTKKQLKVLDRFLIGMSICDIVASISTPIILNLALPSNLPFGNGIGNQATCNAQGFLSQFVTATALYTGCLALSYLLSIKYGWKETKLKPLEIISHITILLFVLISGTTSVILELYNPTPASCTLIEFPPGCSRTNTCIRGADANIWRLPFRTIPEYTTIAFSTIAMVIIYCTVRKIEKKSRYWGSIEAFGQNQQQQQQGPEIGSSSSLGMIQQQQQQQSQPEVSNKQQVDTIMVMEENEDVDDDDDDDIEEEEEDDDDHDTEESVTIRCNSSTAFTPVTTMMSPEAAGRAEAVGPHPTTSTMAMKDHHCISSEPSQSASSEPPAISGSSSSSPSPLLLGSGSLEPPKTTTTTTTAAAAAAAASTTTTIDIVKVSFSSIPVALPSSIPDNTREEEEEEFISSEQLMTSTTNNTTNEDSSEDLLLRGEQRDQRQQQQQQKKNHSSSKRSSNRNRQRRRKLELSREVGVQGICYICAFLVTWTVPTIARCLVRFGGRKLGKEWFIAIQFFLPLQGFFNFLVYIRTNKRLPRRRQQQQQQQG